MLEIIDRSNVAYYIKLIEGSYKSTNADVGLGLG